MGFDKLSDLSDIANKVAKKTTNVLDRAIQGGLPSNRDGDVAKESQTSSAQPFQPLDDAQSNKAPSTPETAATVQSEAVSFEPLPSDVAGSKTKLSKAKVVEDVDYNEPESIFASGLPEWDLDPPGNMVVRKTNKSTKGAL